MNWSSAKVEHGTPMTKLEIGLQQAYKNIYMKEAH
jgi:hypothetical protein